MVPDNVRTRHVDLSDVAVTVVYLPTAAVPIACADAHYLLVDFGPGDLMECE
jgi:hypothetical protein